MDNLSVEGATFTNGNFEETDPETGGLRGWHKWGQVLRVTAPGEAASGKSGVKV